MKKKSLLVKKKIKGLSYALMNNGLELPVLDITHPLFISSIDENKLPGMIRDIEENGEKRAEKFKNMPGWIKKFFARRSFIMAGTMLTENEDSFVSGISTMMMKLGPGLIGKGGRRFWDRLASKTFGSILIRMRVRDVSRLQADSLINRLGDMPDKNLFLLNIGGGTASDSINTLILIHKHNPSLLSLRRIEIAVLDIDTHGPAFAGESVRAVSSPGGCLEGLDISFRHVIYNWNDASGLIPVLREKKDWIIACSSEGGLFEYGDELVIKQNLLALDIGTDPGMQITGSLLRDVDTIDPAIKQTLKITVLKTFMHGTEGMKKILGDTNWIIDRQAIQNPRYIVFTLTKKNVVQAR